MERWRYCCGKCGSHCIAPRTEAGGYRCRGCESVIESRHDKKLDGPVEQTEGRFESR